MKSSILLVIIQKTEETSSEFEAIEKELSEGFEVFTIREVALYEAFKSARKYLNDLEINEQKRVDYVMILNDSERYNLLQVRKFAFFKQLKYGVADISPNEIVKFARKLPNIKNARFKPFLLFTTFNTFRDISGYFQRSHLLSAYVSRLSYITHRLRITEKLSK